MPDPTVLVIGGGATGVGVARDLALRGVDVTVCDRSGLSSGTSSRSHGLLHSGARYAETDAAGAEECIAENEVLRDIAGECIRDTGGLFVQLESDDPDYFQAKLDACEAVGIPTTVHDAATVQEMVPEITDDVVRAFEVPDAVIYPSRLVAANAADARDNGATIHTHAPVEGITVEDEAITGVDVGGTVDATISPEYVINATGAWAGEIAEMADLGVSMRPTRGVMVSVEYDSLEPVLNRCRSPDDGDIVVPHESEAVLGTTSVAVDDPDEYEKPDSEIELTTEECAAMLPAVETAPVVRSWWGVRPLYAPDESDRGGRGISRDFVQLDHSHDGVDNAITVVGGKLTTYRQMAASVADAVADRLGVDVQSTTADHPLPGKDDAERLDEFVAEFDSRGPTDEDIVTT